MRETCGSRRHLVGRSVHIAFGLSLFRARRLQQLSIWFPGRLRLIEVTPRRAQKASAVSVPDVGVFASPRSVACPISPLSTIRRSLECNRIGKLRIATHRNHSAPSEPPSNAGHPEGAGQRGGLLWPPFPGRARKCSFSADSPGFSQVMSELKGGSRRATPGKPRLVRSRVAEFATLPIIRITRGIGIKRMCSIRIAMLRPHRLVRLLKYLASLNTFCPILT